MAPLLGHQVGDFFISFTPEGFTTMVANESLERAQRVQTAWLCLGLACRNPLVGTGRVIKTHF